MKLPYNFEKKCSEVTMPMAEKILDLMAASRLSYAQAEEVLTLAQTWLATAAKLGD